MGEELENLSIEELKKLVEPITQNIVEKINDSLNIFEIGSIISKFILQNIPAEAVELKILEDDGYFSRINFSIKSNDGTIKDFSNIEKLFCYKRTPLKNSLIGKYININQEFCWDESEGISFVEWSNNHKDELYLPSAEIHNKILPCGRLFNHIIIPFIFPKNSQKEIKYQIKYCIHIFNVKILEVNDHDSRLYYLYKFADYIKTIISHIRHQIYTAIYYRRASDEIEVDNKILEITKISNNFESFLDNVVNEFANKLNSPLSSVWYYDKDAKLFGLHSIKCKKIDNIDLDEIELFNIIEHNKGRVLKADNSLLGKFIDYLDITSMKIINLVDDKYQEVYSWKFIFDYVKTEHLIVLPIRDESEIIAILLFHPIMSIEEFEQVSINYYMSFISQITTPLKFFLEMDFRKKSEKLTLCFSNLINLREETFLNEFAKEISDIIDCEACSIYQIIENNLDKNGIYLIASSETSDEMKEKINKKIFDIDDNSITGYIGKHKESSIFYEVEHVEKYYKGFNKNSIHFVENTINKKHYTYIGITIDNRLLIECINKKGMNSRISDQFNNYDKKLLKYAANILERSCKVIEKIKEKNETIIERNEIIDLITHEIENPITSIRYKISVILTRSMEPEQKKLKLEDILSLTDILKKWTDFTNILLKLLQNESIDIDSNNENLHKMIINSILLVNT